MQGNVKCVLVTGAAGMIGSHLVKHLLTITDLEIVGIDRYDVKCDHYRYCHYVVDLGDREKIYEIFRNKPISHVIHLAALAHTRGECDLSFDRYLHVNVECAENVFLVAEEYNSSVLFISTVDVLGFVRGLITPMSQPNPISKYGKSKAMAEQSLKQICSHYDIYRLSPVYTTDVKRDIQKRYYLKEPNFAYKIGRGGQFEVLAIERAVIYMSDWLDSDPHNTVHVIKDEKLLDVNDLIKAEKAEGRAKYVLYFPRWLVEFCYYCLRFVLGKTNKVYLIFKALWPFRTTNNI